MQSSIQSGIRVTGDPIQQFREDLAQLLHSTGLIGALARRANLGGIGQIGQIGQGQQGQQGQIGQRRAAVDVDIYENPESYVALIEVSGLSEQDIEISQGNGQLTIRAQRQPPQAVRSNQTQALLQEIEYGAVQRQFTLPPNVNANAITASVVNGLLTLVIPREAQGQQQKIQVQRGQASSASGSSRS